MSHYLDQTDYVVLLVLFSLSFLFQSFGCQILASLPVYWYQIPDGNITDEILVKSNLAKVLHSLTQNPQLYC